MIWKDSAANLSSCYGALKSFHFKNLGFLYPPPLSFAQLSGQICFCQTASIDPPFSPGFSGPGLLQGHHPGPLGEGERRPTLSSSRRLCPRVQSRRRPQLEVSGQQTHTNVCVEGQRATSPSVPPRCLLSSAFT